MYTDSLGFKQNNVGNLRGAGVAWQGKTGMNRGFAVFADRLHGIRAIYVDLQNKFSAKTNTIEKILNKYAPPAENDTLSYISFVEKHTGFNRSTILEGNFATLRKLVKAICLKETGYPLSDNEANEAEKLIFEKKK